MKKALLLLIIFIAGIALGATVVWFKFVILAGRGAAMIYSSFLESQADTALQLRFGAQDTFLKNLEFSLPDYVQAVNSFGDYDYTRRALWKVKAYYTATGIPIPPEISGILNALPPQPVTANDLKKDKSTITKLGGISPIASVHTIDGQDLDFHGKVVVLNFFATWCGPCMDEMPALEKGVWESFKNEGLVMVSIGQGHSESELKLFQQKNTYSFPFVADPKREIYGKFATAYIPRNVVIGKDGLIKFQSVGFVPEDLAALTKVVKAELEK
jgi:thiol-disulfide isomerase/thioredoxin